MFNIFLSTMAPESQPGFKWISNLVGVCFPTTCFCQYKLEKKQSQMYSISCSIPAETAYKCHQLGTEYSHRQLVNEPQSALEMLQSVTTGSVFTYMEAGLWATLEAEGPMKREVTWEEMPSISYRVRTCNEGLTTPRDML